MQILRVTLRQFARSPGFTAAAVLTLALGIGLSTSSFSIVNLLLLRDLPYPDAGRLARIFRTTPQSRGLPHTPANLLEVRDSATSFSAMAFVTVLATALGEPGEPAEHVTTLAATAEFFDVLGVHPFLGRGFARGDDQPDRPLVAILTHRVWEQRYGADPGVIGRTVRLEARPHTIVGVLPPEFEAPLVWGPTGFITPLTLTPGLRTRRTGAYLQCVARLAPGVSAAQAQVELATIATRLAREYPAENAAAGLTLTPLHDSNIGATPRQLTWLMTGLSLLLLLIACANLASLQIARAFRHSREFAVRAALGGSRRQLMLPLVGESLILAALGGAAGLLVASWWNDVVGALLTFTGTDGLAVPIDGRVFTFALAAAGVSGLAFGLAPAWLSARVSAAEALQDASRSATPSPLQRRLRRILITGQLALVLALVGVAASLGFGLNAFLRRPLGWQPGGVFAGRIVMPASRYGDQPRQREFHRALLERLARIPGVDHAALSYGLPLYSLDVIGRTRPVIAEGVPAPPPGHEPAVESNAVSADYFATLGLKLRQGALFPPGLKAEDPPVAIVNRSLAQAFWPGANPIGRRLRFATGNSARPDEPWMQVIGVVDDVGMLIRTDTPASRLQIHLPLVQVPSGYLAIALHATVPPDSLTPAVRHAVSELDPDIAVIVPGSIRTTARRLLATGRVIILQLGLAAGLGLLISAVGLFGVISQLTAQRTREIGVRLALGAQRGDILQMVLREGLWLLGGGAAAGVVAFLALNRALQQALPEMRLPGAAVLLANLAVLGTVTLLACWLPARRATRVNPVDALRAE